MLEPLEMGLMVLGTLMLTITILFPVWGDNALYAIVLSIYMGSVAARDIFAIWASLRSGVLTPMIQGTLWLIVPLILGILVFSRFTQFRWAARYPTVALAGVGSGVVLGKMLTADVIGNVLGTAQWLTSFEPDPISAIIMFVVVCTTILYFMYSKQYTRVFAKGGALNPVYRVGRILLFAGLGYIMGYMLINLAIDREFGVYSINILGRTIAELQSFLGGA